MEDARYAPQPLLLRVVLLQLCHVPLLPYPNSVTSSSSSVTSLSTLSRRAAPPLPTQSRPLPARSRPRAPQSRPVRPKLRPLASLLYLGHVPLLPHSQLNHVPFTLSLAPPPGP
eukprot:3146531-Rhodomonas_salina.1